MLRKILLLASLAVLVTLTAIPAFAGGPSGDPPGLGRAIAVQESNTNALLAREGVTGTAVGLGPDGQAVIKVYTESAGVAGIPSKLDGVPVEVHVTGELVAQSDPKGEFARPVPIGVSTGSERLVFNKGRWWCSVGTLGARVTDGTDVYALSNNHVYALENEGLIGDRILQPGRVDMTDQGCGSDSEINQAEIGTLSQFVPIVFSRSANNTVDAAIAITTAGAVGNATPSDDGYGAPTADPVVASLGLAVQKYGRTTGLTSGTVTGINATVIIKYDAGRARFVNQIIFEGSGGSMSASGDSGSLIVSQGSNDPVALLFAGSDTVTIGNPIGLVLAALGVTIDGADATPLTDIAITSVSAPANVAQGSQADVDVTVQNVGNQDVTGDIIVSLAETPGGTTFTPLTVTGGLSAGAFTVLTFSWNTTGASLGDHTLTASHNVTDEIAGNNSKSATVTVTDPSQTQVILAESVIFRTEAKGKSGKVKLFLDIHVVADNVGGDSVGGATVSVEIFAPDGTRYVGSADTNGSGNITFEVPGNAMSGVWNGSVTDIQEPGFQFDSSVGDSSDAITI